MNRSKIYRINLDVYKRKVVVVYTTNVDDYTKRIIKKYPKMEDKRYEEADGSTLAWSLYELAEYEELFIILPKGSGPALLHHEVVHIVDAIMDFFGLEGTETRAYMGQHIIEHIYK